MKFSDGYKIKIKRLNGRPCAKQNKNKNQVGKTNLYFH